MPLPLESEVYWKSFNEFLDIRRHVLLAYLEENGPDMSLDKHYIDLFFNELVRRI